LNRFLLTRFLGPILAVTFLLAAPRLPGPALRTWLAPSPTPAQRTASLRPVSDAVPATSAPARPTPTAVPSTATPTAVPPTATPQPTPSATPRPQANGKVIFVDAGHGGADSGAAHKNAAGVEDLLEKEANLWIATHLADALRAKGYQVVLSRSTDSFAIPGASTAVELQKRVDMANQAGADLYVAIHNNGNDNKSVRGTEVLYCNARTFTDKNIRLATLVQAALVRNLRAAGYNTVDRGIKDDVVRGHLAVLAPANLARATRMPGIIGESLFLSNEADAAALKRADIRQAIVQGYLEGIQAYFG
jgi:N-acetylmuramoyl-L-alanine amidase